MSSRDQLRAHLSLAYPDAERFLQPALFTWPYNGALDSPDVDYVRRQICCISTAISQTDEVLAGLRGLLDLYNDCRSLQAETKRLCEALVSPLRSLPVELLGQIFVLACAEFPDKRREISQVCRSWRETAIATSELWTKAYLPTFEWTPRPNVAKLLKQHYLDLCILRSQSRSMRWECWEDQHHEVETQAELMSPVLRSTSCDELIWTSNGRGGSETILDVFNQVLPDILASSSRTLQTLVIRTTVTEEWWFGAGMPVGLKPLSLDGFTQIEKFHLSTVHPLPQNSLKLAWANITNLSINTPLADYSTIQAIFTHCRNLKVCEFVIPKFTGSWTLRGPIYLSKIQKLRLSSLIGEFFHWVLDTIQAPSLTDLVVESEHMSEFDPIPIHKFLSACSTTLRRLWIGPISGYEIRDIIAPTVPFLEELGLMLHRNYEDDPLDALQVDVYTEPLLPHLRALTIVSLPRDDVHSSFMSIVGNRGMLPHGCDDEMDADSRRLKTLRYMRLYQYDPDWTYSDLDIQEEQAWKKNSPDFDVRFAREEKEFRANFLTSPEWPTIDREEPSG